MFPPIGSIPPIGSTRFYTQPSEAEKRQQLRGAQDLLTRLNLDASATCGMGRKIP